MNGERRLAKEQGFNAVHHWLKEKVIDQTDPFGWIGYSLTTDQIREVSSKASKDFEHGWLI